MSNLGESVSRRRERLISRLEQTGLLTVYLHLSKVGCGSSRLYGVRKDCPPITSVIRFQSMIRHEPIGGSS